MDFLPTFYYFQIPCFLFIFTLLSNLECRHYMPGAEQMPFITAPERRGLHVCYPVLAAWYTDMLLDAAAVSGATQEHAPSEQQQLLLRPYLGSSMSV